LTRGLRHQQVEVRSGRRYLTTRAAGFPDRRFDAIRQAAQIAAVLVVPDSQFGAPQKRDLAMQQQGDIGGVLRREVAPVVQLLAGGKPRKQQCGDNHDRHQRDDGREVKILLALRVFRQRRECFGERSLGTVEDLLHRVASFTSFAQADRC
jgi:hypothetical protein